MNYTDKTKEELIALLEATEDKYRTIYNKSPIAIELYDASGNLLQVNNSCLALFGVENIDEIKGFSLFADPNISDAHKEKLSLGESIYYQGAFDFELVKSQKLYATTREGIIWIDVLITPLDTSRRSVGGYLIQIQDITERKATEEALNEALERAEASDRLKTAFLNNISHEVRTPLNGILGFVELIDDPDMNADDRVLYKEILHTSADRLLNTINSYMDISLIVSGNMQVNKSGFDLTELLNQGCSSFLKEAEAKGIIINQNYPDVTDGIILNSDPEMIRKVYFHLLTNAVKFTEFGAINIGYKIDGSEVEITVEDSGIGIREDIRDRIFDSFLQADLSNTRKHEGSGLGLAIAKGLVDLLGGKIWVKSIEGYGSTFGFSVPGLIMPEIEVVPNEPVNIQAADSQTVILIAEDDPINIYLLEQMLGKTKAVIWHVENGQLAVNFCKTHPELSLVLMDLKMPVMGGFEATRLIKSFRNDLPVIAVTAYAMPGDKELAQEAGCDDYISKPFSSATLKEKLRQYCLI